MGDGEMLTVAEYPKWEIFSGGGGSGVSILGMRWVGSGDEGVGGDGLVGSEDEDIGGDGLVRFSSARSINSWAYEGRLFGV